MEMETPGLGLWFMPTQGEKNYQVTSLDFVTLNLVLMSSSSLPSVKTRLFFESLSILAIATDFLRFYSKNKETI